MNTMDKLNDVIQTLLTEKTLSLEALPHIQKLKDTVTELEEKLRSAEAKLTNRDNSIANLTRDNEALQQKFNVLKKAEDAMAAREARVFELEKSAAVANAFKDAYRDSMAIVFASNAMRQRVIASSGSTNPNGQFTSHNEDSTRTLVEGYNVPSTPGVRDVDNLGNRSTL